LVLVERDSLVAIQGNFSRVDEELRQTKEELENVRSEMRAAIAAMEAQTRMEFDRPRSIRVVIPRNPDKPVDGIISYLRRVRSSGNNVHDSNVVTITMSNTPVSRRAARNAAEFNPNIDACTNNSSGEYILWDFHDQIVRVTQYSIMSSQYCVGYCHLRSWNLEGSLDGKTYEVLGEERNRDDLNGPGKIGSFDVKKLTLCRFLRLAIAGPTHRSDYYIVISGLEIFGLLIDSE
jgi:hypothetical protein